MKTKLLSMLILAASAFLPCAATAQVAEPNDPSYLISPKGIARVNITLLNDKNIDDIKRDEISVPAEKLEAVMTFENQEGSTYTEDELYDGRILIKGRGNTSWNLPKHPYSIDLVDETGEDNPFGLLGMPAAEEWALIAFWTDRSCMRIPFAYFLGSMMDGIRYSPRSRFVELYINDDYRGIYALVEKIERSKDRVDIKKLDESKENGINGGYILEAIPEGRVKDKERNTFFVTQGGKSFIFNYPKPKNATQEQVAWIKNYLDEFELALDRKDFTEETGYLKYADPSGFYDWLILHDLSKGVDNLFHCSVFVEKDYNGKLRMSAPWDFDLSFGNAGGSTYYEDEMWTQKSGWWNRMWRDPKFSDKMIERYDELIPLFDQIPAILAANYYQLESTGAIERNNTRWPQILPEFTDREGRKTPTTIKGHVRWMAEWIESRKVWLYTHYTTSESRNCSRLKNSRPVIRVCDPESFEEGKASDVRVVQGYEEYIWDGDFHTTVPVFRIDDDKEHTVQVVDKHGHVSLPSLPIKRGEAYAESFGKSNTTAINDIVADDSKGMVMLINGDSREVRICYPAAEDATLTINVYDLKGAVVYTTTIAAESGLGVYSTQLTMLTAGNYLVKCSAGTAVVTKKVNLK